MHNAMSDDEIPPLPDYAAGLEADQAFGEPKISSAEGIERMTARVKGLSEELDLLTRGDKPDLERYARVRQQLQEARQRLSDYQLQHGAKN
jgi:hypothetical protein